MIWRRLNLLQHKTIISLHQTTIKPLHNLSSSPFSHVSFHQIPHHNSLSSIKPTLLTPHIVLSTLLNCPSDLLSLTFFLWSARQPNYFHTPPTFHHMVNVLTRLTQRFKTLEQLLNELERVGCTTNPQTLLLLLRIYWRAGMFNMVFETFEGMFKYGYTPNTFARNIVMDVLFKIGRVDVALRVLNETQIPNFLSFSIAICNLCKNNDLVKVQGVLADMLSRGYYLNADAFLMILSCWCRLGRLKEALQLFGLMITLGIPTSVKVWSILIDGFCKSRKLDMAHYLFEKMIETGCSPNFVTCTSLIKGYMESQKPSSALSILSYLESRGSSPDLILCNVLIDCLSKLGRYNDALDVFYSLPERNLLPDSYTFCSVMSIVCLSRQFVLLPILISGLVIEPDLVLCNSLLSYFCKAGYPFGAIEFYCDMIARGFIPDRYSYAGLLTGLCGAGRINEAVNVYRGILSNQFGLDAHVHTVIVGGLIKTGNFHRAIRLFRKAAAEDYPLDVVSYTVAINGLFRGNRSEEAYALYSQMKEVGVAPNARTCNIMLCGASKERDVNVVEQILQEMIDTRIELDCNCFNMIKKLIFKSSHSLSICNLLIELWDLGLMSDKDMCTLLNNGFANGINVVGEAHLSLLRQRMAVDIVNSGTSSSDDIPDVAASVG